MHWIVGLRVDVPEYVGAGDFRQRIPRNWKQTKVAVRLADQHPREGWTVDGEFVEPSPEDGASAAPYGRAPNELVLLAACRGFMKQKGAGTYAQAFECSAHGDPEPVAEPVSPPKPAAEIDLSKPLPRSVLNSLKFFTLQKHVQALTGLKPANKEKALELLETGNLIAA